MKIFEFAYPKGETDWIFAPDIKEAKKFYLNYTGCGDLEGVKIKDIPKSEWKNQYLIDPEDTEPDEDEEGYNEDDYWAGMKIIETFAEYAERNTVTDMIATTEY